MKYILLSLFTLVIVESSAQQRGEVPAQPGPTFYDFLDRVDSKFNENADGWRIADLSGNNEQATRLVSWGYDTSGPGEHDLFYLQGDMPTIQHWFYWHAPEKFHGNWMFSNR